MNLQEVIEITGLSEFDIDQAIKDGSICLARVPGQHNLFILEMERTDHFFSIEEIIELTGISSSCLNAAIKANEIESRSNGREILINAKDVYNYLNKDQYTN